MSSLGRSAARTATIVMAAALALVMAVPATAQDTTPSPSSTTTPTTPVTPATPTTPGPPTITSVVAPTSGRTLVLYVAAPEAPGSSPITGYQFSLNGTDWMPCDEGAMTCTVTSLQNDITYYAVVRAVTSEGVGTPSAPKTGVARFVDSAKPADLPKPRKWVSASFNADGNNLGVDGARTRLGVGTLPQITFTSAIPAKRVVESHLKVVATREDGRRHTVKGAWGWIDDKRVVFRPENYWPGHSLITITSSLGRAVLGKDGAKYLVGRESLDTTYSFRTDRRLIIKVDGERVNMKVFIDGVKAKTFAVSLGKSEWETRNGVKVISTDKEPFHTYTSTSLGLDPSQEEPYVLENIPWNTRLTPTGEFIHSAPWAYGRLGRYNGSHGCTNMFEQDAKWIYQKTIPGDVVEYVNTGGDTVQPWNGPGGLWNISWSDWLKKSALGNASGTVVTSDTSNLPTTVSQDVGA